MRKKVCQIAMMFAMLFAFTANNAKAQLKLEDILGQIGLDDILSKAQVIKIDKGFSPKFHLGNYQINTVGLLGEHLKGINILGEILDKKNSTNIMKMYKTYKTGLVVYKILASAGTVVAVASTVKGISADNKFDDKDVKAMLYPALTSIASGVITKLVTKKASYKAVDVFNGVAKKTIKDIFSVAPASQTLGVGVYMKL